MDINSDAVLVLNKNWQAINTTKICDAISMIYSGAATGLHISEEKNMIPMIWQDWINLPCNDNFYIGTINGKIKIPKIIILCNFNKIPKKRPRFTANNLKLRDNCTCQYTGKKLGPNDGNIDHIIPKSRGGKTDWYNCVLSHKDINSLKADKTPEEAGLCLIRKPDHPKILPTTCYIKNKFEIKEWETFLNF
jgi:5-methylcytosine-specific restriction endonuclease McrA